jgi:predicted nuclease of predicted toxin-antitoxin system
MARYLIDANLPRHLTVWNSEICELVADIDPSLPDKDIWAYASDRGLVIVSKDADFADRVLLSTSGPSVIHLKIGNMKFRELDEFLVRIWGDICTLSAQYRLIQVFADRIEAIG